MKKYISLSAALLATAPALAGDVNKLVFDQALTLSSPAIALQTEKVDLKLDKRDNAWHESSVKKEVKRCGVEIKIEGRDLATSNPILGEHYFGSMQVACPSFKTKFSRVLFLGIRNCVESETMVDQDYCKLVAVAMRKESDISAANGDLIRNDQDKRTFMRISSEGAKGNFRAYSLAPEGLNVDTLDSFQIFELSIGKTGSEFFIPGTNALASFSGGMNNYLTMNDTSRDAAIGKKVDTSLDDLESIVHAIPRATKPSDALNEKLPEFLGKFSGTVKDLLSIISPVEYFGREKRLKQLEADVVELSKTYFPSSVTDRDSFVRGFGGKNAEYARVQGYLAKRSKDVDYKRILSPSASGAVVSGSKGDAFVHAPYNSEILASNFSGLPAGSRVIANRDITVMANTSDVIIGSTTNGRNCFIQMNNASTGSRLIAKGTEFEVESASGDGYYTPRANFKSQLVSTIYCSQGQLNIGQFFNAVSGSFTFLVAAPQVVR